MDTQTNAVFGRYIQISWTLPFKSSYGRNWLWTKILQINVCNC